MIVRLPNEFLSVISQNDGLQQYLNNLLVGKEYTPRSWLYESVENPDDILKTWMGTLSQLESGSSFEQEVYHFDTSQIEKWGPQGGVKPISELMETVLAGFRDESPRPTAFSSAEWRKAKRIASDDFRRLRLSLRPASYYKVVDDMRARDTLESNSGWPLFTRRNKPDVIEQAVTAAHNGQWKTYPAIALFRNYNNKTRLVWMFPMAANVKEGSYLQPLQSAMINRLQKAQDNPLDQGYFLRYFMPWIGFDAVRKQIDHTYNTMAQEIAASDFSATDAHFTKWHSLEVFDVIKECFQPEYRAGLKESLLAMHTIPLLIGPKFMITGLHGVSSGSNWTNFIETIFDYIFSIYVWEKSAKPSNYDSDDDWYGLSGIGDDMAWTTVEGVMDAFPQFLEQCAKEVGHEANAEKTNAHEGRVKYLQRLFQRGYNRDDGCIRAVYSTIRALKSSVYPEKFHKKQSWNSDMFCARQYMILENCVDHPLFKDFVAFVVKGQKDLIPFAFQTASELDRINGETKLIPGLNPTYNQEKRDKPLSEFDSV